MTLVTVLGLVLATGASQPDDGLSTPRGAARVYLTALLAGDAEGALAMVAPCSDDARKAVAGSAAIYGALRRLDRSIAVGLDGGRATDASDRLALQLQRVDTAWLVVAGDRAVLRFAVGDPMILRWTPGGWRVWVKERGAGEPSGDELLRLGRAFDGAARDVAEGLAGGAVSQLLDGVRRASAGAVDRAIVAL